MKRLLNSQNLVVFRSVKNGSFSDNSTRFPLNLFFVVPPQKRMPLQSGLNEKAFLFFKILSGIQIALQIILKITFRNLIIFLQDFLRRCEIYFAHQQVVVLRNWYHGDIVYKLIFNIT